VILRKKTLEDHNYDLRKVEVYPGTGPFKSVRRAENEVWVMERNQNYWNQLPYPDGIEFFVCRRQRDRRGTTGILLRLPAGTT